MSLLLLCPRCVSAVVGVVVVTVAIVVMHATCMIGGRANIIVIVDGAVRAASV